MDEDNPLVREWGLWAVRNLCGNEEIQRAIGELQACEPVASPELAALGMQLSLNQGTGRLEAVTVPVNLHGQSSHVSHK